MGKLNRVASGGASALARRWPVLLVVLVVFLLGLTAGSFSSSRLEQGKAQELSLYLRGFVTQVGGVEFEPSKMARHAMTNNLIMVGAIYILGLTFIGMPVILAILFGRGFILGFAVGFIARDLSAEGVLLAMASIIPHNLFYIPALLLGSASSLTFILLLWKRNFNTEVRILPGLLRYTAVMSVVLLVTLGAALVEGYLTPVFTKAAAGFISTGFTVR